MNKKTQKIIVGISLLIAAASIGYLAYYYMGISKNEVVYEEIKEEVYVEPSQIEITLEETEEEVFENPIDFDALHEINPDIYAWIEIEGTQISYPILQSATDDSYYLNTTAEGVSGLPGSIYTESASGQDFEVFNTVIYGHNMNDDSMFGGLNLYRDLDYMIEHETLMIYTEDAILEFQIYAAATFDNTHLLYKYDFDDPEDCQEFLDDTVDAKDLNKAIRDDVEVTIDDTILTMSTCIANQSSNRLLVEAVLVNEQRR